MNIQQAETVSREFAIQFPTPNAQRAVRHAEVGEISWFEVYGLFQRAAQAALSAIDGVVAGRSEPHANHEEDPH